MQERNTTSTKSYFALDGSYGSAWGLVVVDTTRWSNAMWGLVEDCSDDVRGELAEHFANNVHHFEKHHDGAEPRCEWCSLSEEDLQEENIVKA
jgi:hypothetical protein